MAVRVLAALCSKDVRSATGSNLSNITKMIKLDPSWDNLARVKTALLGIKAEVPAEDCWRIQCLTKFLAERYTMAAQQQDTEYIDKLIDSLCTS